METINQLAEVCGDNGIPFRRNEPLSAHCTFKTGGPADLLVEPQNEGQLPLLLKALSESPVPHMILGKGSNVLFDDGGYRGVILQIGAPLGEIRLLDETTIHCGSGASLLQLCTFAWEQGLSGLEFAYGIPGSVGGAVYMNAGAYGGEMKDVLTASHHLLPDGTTGTLAGEEMELSYRHSAYSAPTRNHWIITAGVFHLRKDDKTAIRARMDDYMGRRREKQPLEFPSAGSTFKRPEGDYASALIDRCGLKGRRVGGAMVSEKHAGFIVNAGGATSAEIKALIALVQEEVQSKTGFRLECEVRIVH